VRGEDAGWMGVLRMWGRRARRGRWCALNIKEGVSLMGDVEGGEGDRTVMWGLS
jgi:hypothetical protein